MRQLRRDGRGRGGAHAARGGLVRVRAVGRRGGRRGRRTRWSARSSGGALHDRQTALRRCCSSVKLSVTRAAFKLPLMLHLSRSKLPRCCAGSRVCSIFASVFFSFVGRRVFFSHTFLFVRTIAARCASHSRNLNSGLVLLSASSRRLPLTGLVRVSTLACNLAFLSSSKMLFLHPLVFSSNTRALSRSCSVCVGAPTTRRDAPSTANRCELASLAASRRPPLLFSFFPFFCPLCQSPLAYPQVTRSVDLPPSF